MVLIDVETPVEKHNNPQYTALRAEQEVFLAAVRGEAPMAVTGPDGLRALELAQAVVTSGKGKRSIIMSIAGR